jgi:hypothetical protein
MVIIGNIITFCVTLTTVVYKSILLIFCLHLYNLQISLRKEGGVLGRPDEFQVESFLDCMLGNF